LTKRAISGQQSKYGSSRARHTIDRNVSIDIFFLSATVFSTQPQYIWSGFNYVIDRVIFILI